MSKETKKEVTINKEQGLFVIPCGEGFTCLGFDVCQNRIVGIENELSKLTGQIFNELPPKDTIESYNRYDEAIKLARAYHLKTGYRFTCELHPLLIGKEGKRVEVTDKAGNKRRFIVGKSTGFIPCHLEIKTIHSNGGESVLNDFNTVKVFA